MDFETVSAALASAVTGLLAYDGATKLRGFASLPGAIEPPTFAPTELEIGYHGTFQNRGLSEITFTCGLFASLGDTDRGRKMLNGYLNPETGTSASIAATLETDKTLGGACKQLVVLKVRGMYRLYEVGNNDYLGAMIDVKVWG